MKNIVVLSGASSPPCELEKQDEVLQRRREKLERLMNEKNGGAK